MWKKSADKYETYDISRTNTQSACHKVNSVHANFGIMTEITVHMEYMQTKKHLTKLKTNTNLSLLSKSLVTTVFLHVTRCLCQ